MFGICLKRIILHKTHTYTYLSISPAICTCTYVCIMRATGMCGGQMIKISILKIILNLFMARVKTEEIRKGRIFVGLWLFGGYVWRSFPFANQMKNVDKPKNTYETAGKRTQAYSFSLYFFVFLCFDPRIILNLFTGLTQHPEFLLRRY